MAIIGSNKETSNGLRFNGKNSYVAIPHKDYLKKINEFTIDIRVNFSDISNKTSKYDWKCVFGKSSYADLGLLLSWSKTLNFYHGGLTPSYTSYSWSDLETNKWYDIRLSYDGFETKIIIDGRVVSSRIVTGNLIENENLIRLGISDAEYYPLNGYLKDFKIYNRVLKNNEVSDDDLIANYSLDELKGNVVRDKAMANDATVYNIERGIKDSNRGIRFNGIDGALNYPVPLQEASYLKSYSVETILKTEGLSDGSIFQNSLGGNDRNGMVISGSLVTFGYYNGSSWIGVYSYIPVNEYVHIVAVNDKGALAIYVNGIKSTSSASLYVHTVDGLHIGRTSVDTRPYFKGSMSMFRIYNYSLSEADVLESYSGDGLSFGVVVDYDLINQDVNSTIVADSSNNGYDANKIGGVKYIQRVSKKNPETHNLVSDFKNWTLGGGSYLMKDGVAVLPQRSSFVMSPAIPVFNVPSLTLSAEYFSHFPTSDIQSKVVYHANSSYYDKNMNPILNSWGYTANGNADVVGDTGVWSTRNNWNVGLGSQVRFVKFRIECSSLTPTSIQVRNPMVSPHVNYTNFIEHRLGNRKKKSKSIPKKSFKSYPFEFKRESVAINNGNLIGINQPRNSLNGGILVEEGAINYSINPSFKSLNNWGLSTNGGGSFTTDGRWGKISVPNGETGKFYYLFQSINRVTPANQPVTFSVAFKNDIVGKFSLRLVMFVGGEAPQQPQVEVVLDGSGIPKTYSVTAVHTANSSGLRLDILAGSYYTSYGGLSNLSFEFSDVQIEDKGYATSFTANNRSKENLYIPNIAGYLDSERGSIELEFDTISGTGVNMSILPEYGLHDMVHYVGGMGGFIIRRGSGHAYDFYVYDKTGVLRNAYSDVAWKNGDSIKYRIDWNSANNLTRLTINDSTVLSLPMFKSLPNDYPLYIGSRDNQYGCGSAIYKSFVVRNRNGESVFKI